MKKYYVAGVVIVAILVIVAGYFTWRSWGMYLMVNDRDVDCFSEDSSVVCTIDGRVGGVIGLADGYRFIVPAGAFEGEIDFSVQSFDNGVYNIEPVETERVEFIIPAIVELPYDPILRRLNKTEEELDKLTLFWDQTAVPTEVDQRYRVFRSKVNYVERTNQR